jgi:hypothetical protein
MRHADGYNNQYSLLFLPKPEPHYSASNEAVDAVISNKLRISLYAPYTEDSLQHNLQWKANLPCWSTANSCHVRKHCRGGP